MYERVKAFSTVKINIYFLAWDIFLISNFSPRFKNNDLYFQKRRHVKIRNFTQMRLL